MITISSPQNDYYRRLEDLQSGKGIRRWNEALVHGLRFGSEIARDFPKLVIGWIVSEELAQTFKPTEGQRLTALGKELFRELDIFGTGEPILHVSAPAVAQETNPATPPKGQLDLVVPFQNPDNLGAIVRTAAALGIRRALLTEEAANPLHPKSIRASAGAVFRLPLVRVPALADLNLDWTCCVALSAEGSDISKLTWPAGGFLIPGVEGPGLPDALRRKCKLAAIPIAQGVESLNGMAAAAIALYSWRTRLR